MVETTCSGCGVRFLVKAYRLTRNRSGLLFCSSACRERDGRTTGRPRPSKPLLTCPICGAEFHRKPAETLAVNYCSYACAARGTANLRPPSKGERRSPLTEFGARPPTNRVALGTVRIRERKGERRAWIKVAEPNVWRARAVVVWELQNGPLPPGMVVHHRNRDALDDQPGNLEALSRARHLHEHRPDFETKRASRAADRRRR